MKLNFKWISHGHETQRTCAGCFASKRLPVSKPYFVLSLLPFPGINPNLLYPSNARGRHSCSWNLGGCNAGAYSCTWILAGSHKTKPNCNVLWEGIFSLVGNWPLSILHPIINCNNLGMLLKTSIASIIRHTGCAKKKVRRNASNKIYTSGVSPWQSEADEVFPWSALVSKFYCL